MVTGVQPSFCSGISDCINFRECSFKGDTAITICLRFLKHGTELTPQFPTLTGLVTEETLGKPIRVWRKMDLYRHRYRPISKNTTNVGDDSGKSKRDPGPACPELLSAPEALAGLNQLLRIILMAKSGGQSCRGQFFHRFAVLHDQ